MAEVSLGEEPGAKVGRERAVLTLEHDMGLVRPNAVVEHEFTVFNPTSVVWNIREVVKSCNCTMARPSSDCIRPHSKLEFQVQYRMPNRSADKTDRVTVRFRETGAPEVVLVTRARVRAPLTVSPAEVTFGTLGRGCTAAASVEVYNYAENDWNGLSTKVSDKWVSVESHLASTKSAEPGLRQVWRVVARCDTASLKVGSHQCMIVISPDLRGSMEQGVRAHVTVMPPVEPVPHQLFFGKVATGGAAKARVGVHFAPGSAPRDATSVTLTHDLGSALSVAWTRAEGRFWQLEATLRAGRAHGIIEGTLDIQFADGALPTVHIPLYALVE